MPAILVRFGEWLVQSLLVKVVGLATVYITLWFKKKEIEKEVAASTVPLEQSKTGADVEKNTPGALNGL